MSSEAINEDASVAAPAPAPAAAAVAAAPVTPVAAPAVSAAPQSLQEWGACKAAECDCEESAFVQPATSESICTRCPHPRFKHKQPAAPAAQNDAAAALMAKIIELQQQQQQIAQVHPIAYAPQQQQQYAPDTPMSPQQQQQQYAQQQQYGQSPQPQQQQAGQPQQQQQSLPPPQFQDVSLGAPPPASGGAPAAAGSAAPADLPSSSSSSSGASEDKSAAGGGAGASANKADVGVLTDEQRAAKLNALLPVVFPFGAPVPEPSKEKNTAECQLCEQKFTMSFRRHHCRACGKCVCGPCSKRLWIFENHPSGKKPARVDELCFRGLQLAFPDVDPPKSEEMLSPQAKQEKYVQALQKLPGPLQMAAGAFGPKIKCFCTVDNIPEAHVQPFYYCEECDPEHKEGVCVPCSKLCHGGHKLYFIRQHRSHVCQCHQPKADKPRPCDIFGGMEKKEYEDTCELRSVERQEKEAEERRKEDERRKEEAEKLRIEMEEKMEAARAHAKMLEDEHRAWQKENLRLLGEILAKQ